MHIYFRNELGVRLNRTNTVFGCKNLAIVMLTPDLCDKVSSEVTVFYDVTVLLFEIMVKKFRWFEN